MKKKDPPKQHTARCLADYRHSYRLGALMIGDQEIVADQGVRTIEYVAGQDVYFATKAAAAAFCDHHKGRFVYLGKV